MSVQYLNHVHIPSYCCLSALLIYQSTTISHRSLWFHIFSTHSMKLTSTILLFLCRASLIVLVMIHIYMSTFRIWFISILHIWKMTYIISWKWVFYTCHTFVTTCQSAIHETKLLWVLYMWHMCGIWYTIEIYINTYLVCCHFWICAFPVLFICILEISTHKSIISWV